MFKRKLPPSSQKWDALSLRGRDLAISDRIERREGEDLDSLFSEVEKSLAKERRRKEILKWSAGSLLTVTVLTGIVAAADRYNTAQDRSRKEADAKATEQIRQAVIRDGFTPVHFRYSPGELYDVTFGQMVEDCEIHLRASGQAVINSYPSATPPDVDHYQFDIVGPPLSDDFPNYQDLATRFAPNVCVKVKALTPKN